MEQKITILDNSIVNTLLEQQQQILNLLKGKTNDSGEFCSVKDAAKILNISEQKIRLMLDNDELKYRKLGRAIRIYRSCLI
ncbi:MAG: Helix-turn-helix domain [Proteobacteria bacterium]|nr:Helix-turn-helix domain [Pseudomonadota bacterium]